jgi:hypothetical protein
MKYEEFIQTGNITNMEEAIKKQRLILKAIEKEAEQFSKELDCLGVLLKLKYIRTDKKKELKEAIEKAEEAVRLTPADHPDLPG